MGTKREYDLYMRRLIPASVAGFAVVLLIGFSSAQAQVHGTPTSVTSIGFGGNFDRPGVSPSVTSVGPRGFGEPAHTFVGSGFQPQPPGVPPSVTSVGPRGFGEPAHTFVGSGFQPQPQRGPQQPSMHHPHRGANAFGQIYAVPYYVPTYVVDQPAAEDFAPAQVEESNYPSGPTIFDRRGSGQTSQAAETAYAERMQREPAPQREALPAPPSQSLEASPAVVQPATVLVYKDGHQLEVQNYAIVGSTLYDLTSGHRNRIALSDLDLAATAKQNDERGIDFQLPVKSDATN